MLNKIFIMGRLTRDPELRRTQSGTAVTSFSLAVDRDFKSQTGEKETDFIDVVAWRNTAEFVSKYFTKGRMAVVEGRLQLRDWQDRQGNNRRTAEVIADSVYFGDSNPARTAAPAYGAPAQYQPQQGVPAPAPQQYQQRQPAPQYQQYAPQPVPQPQYQQEQINGGFCEIPDDGDLPF